MNTFLKIATGVVIAGLVVFILFRYFFVFGRGVKAGELNYVVEKGYLFKTYEGKLIQSGIRSKAPGSVQSYEFEFSIADPAIAKKLMVNSGKMVQLHYKEYVGTLPWRGYSNFVVDSILSITDLPR
ncbi:hypothetical protein Q4E93_20240 [Flavitalea sp. BT771]|uniref:hypothetical protein n=1 Tax=Flavitalea sp. BT771 TaxID=3063329 RepID=UPI0026E1CF07|nr:hypothetical protein [Flavitalea sp. BT771]MDO6432949.1 hypothetical protein [Flavitalea sp. BT771]MDV6221775.1 hypothetical protein [Flavitalea sp. BT771]